MSEAHVSPFLKQWGLLVLELGSVRKDLDVSSCGDPRLLQPDHVSGKPHAQCSGMGAAAFGSCSGPESSASRRD